MWEKQSSLMKNLFPLAYKRSLPPPHPTAFSSQTNIIDPHPGLENQCLRGTFNLLRGSSLAPMIMPVRWCKAPMITPVRWCKAPMITPVRWCKAPMITPVRWCKAPMITPVRWCEAPMITPVKWCKAPMSAPVRWCMARLGAPVRWCMALICAPVKTGHMVTQCACNRCVQQVIQGE